MGDCGQPRRSPDSPWFVAFLGQLCGILPKLVSVSPGALFLLHLGPGLMVQSKAVGPEEKGGGTKM